MQIVEIVLLKNLSSGLSAMNENNRKDSSSNNKPAKKLRRRIFGTKSFGAKQSAAKTNNSASFSSVQDSLSENAKAFKQYVGIRSIFNPLWCLFGLRICVVILTVFGLFMVFSSSSVTMITYGAGPWGSGMSQLIYCVIGLIGYLVFSHLPVDFYKSRIITIYAISVFMQFLTFVPGIRHEVNGNASWIKIGPLTMQPAEITKLAICIWLPMALILAKKAYKRVAMRAYIPTVVALGVSVLLVVAGKDLGTALIILLIAIVAFYVGGFPIKWLVVALLTACTAVLLLVITSQNRMRRILATIQGCDAKSIRGVCFQAIHAQYAMASGGIMGVGIGNSREKWNYLPYAHNDFIFAIIGEEMGFVVASCVILLYIVIGWCLLTSALQSTNKLVSISLISIATWIVGQGLINILVVVQLLPVMGVPMPFVSAGGSSLVMCLLAMGVADSFIKSNPNIKLGNKWIFKLTKSQASGR